MYLCVAFFMYVFVMYSFIVFFLPSVRSFLSLFLYVCLYVCLSVCLYFFLYVINVFLYDFITLLSC